MYFGVRLLPTATATQAQISAAEAIAIFRRHSSWTSSSTLKPRLRRLPLRGLASGLAWFIGWL